MDASDASPAPRLPSSNTPKMGFTTVKQRQAVMEVIDLTDSPPGSPPRLTYRPPPAIVSQDERPTKRQRTIAPSSAPSSVPPPPVPSAPITATITEPRAVPRPSQIPIAPAHLSPGNFRLPPAPKAAAPAPQQLPPPPPPPPPRPAVTPKPARGLAECLQAQVVPILSRYLRDKPNVISTGVTTAIVKSLLSNSGFHAERNRTGGNLSPAFVQNLEIYLAREIPDQIAKHQQANGLLGHGPKVTQAPPPIPPAGPPTLVPTPTPTPTPTLKKEDLQQTQLAQVKPRPATGSKAATSTKRTEQEYPGLQRSTSRPYLPVSVRKAVSSAATKRLVLNRQHVSLGPVVYHVDFNRQEIEAVRAAVRIHQGKQGSSRKEPLRELGKILRKSEVPIEMLAQQMCLKDGLKDRDIRAVLAFLQDAVKKLSTDPGRAQTLTLQVKEPEVIKRPPTKKRISSLLLAREIEGNRGFGRMRRHVNFTQEFRKAREDDMDLRAEWTNCAGDIATISWVGDGQHFVCGTTTHSDSHNQQYNKPGNLLLCSPDKGRLQAYADHRIVRPIVQTGENGTDAMRESQEPWLYSSVVSSDYDAVNRLAYTSSFDKTVKVWSIDEDAGTMRSILTWPHEGVVNFVAASKNGSGLIATAADVPNLAVRIYHVDRSGRTTACTPLAGLRSWNEDDQSTLAPQTWAYFPATMQWGISKNAQHLLLVGYSPRSLTGDDNDIPPEKRNSGEILLWDCIKNERCKVLTASTQNVFEVAWHPTQPCFVVATSPSGLLVKENVRTQIRLFRPSYNPDQAGAFSEVQCLDCPAIDINELTIVPNSLAYCYVTAAATDGCVYVWDTAQGDDPVHRLQHGTPLEGDASEEHYNRERDDTGVKFTAWGTSLDRFYTGGSDGVVKVWNIRAEYKPLVRVILEAPAPISAGSFAPDKTKLAIGDATGRVYLFSVNEMEALEKTAIKLPPGFAGNVKPIRRPRPYTRHTTPAPPPNSNPNPSPTTGIALASRYLARGQIQINPRRLIGAVQGPAYPTLGLYRNELHMDGSWQAPLLAHVEQQQQENMTMFKGSSRLPLLLKPVYNPAEDSQHSLNHALDLHLGDLPEETQLELRMAGVNLDDPIEEATDWGLQYEEA